MAFLLYKGNYVEMKVVDEAFLANQVHQISGGKRLIFREGSFLISEIH